MNERVKELAKEANIYPYMNLNDFRRYDVVDYHLGKFAELIIAECAYMARQCKTVRAIDAEDVAQYIEESLGGK